MEQNSMARFGTIAFDFEYMLGLINFGVPYQCKETMTIKFGPPYTNLSFTAWEKFVPKVYFDDIGRIIASVHKPLINLVWRRVCRETQEEAVKIVHGAIWRDLVPRGHDGKPLNQVKCADFFLVIDSEKVKSFDG